MFEPAESLEDSASGLEVFFEDSDSTFEESSVTDVVFSVTGFDSVFVGSECNGALVLLLFAPGLDLVSGIGLVLFTSAAACFPLLAGGSGGFPDNGFRLLFFLKTVCCLLTAGDAPFF